MVDREILLEQARGEIEKQFIQAALRNADDNQTLVAQMMSVHRNTLNRKIAVHNLNGRNKY